MNKKHICPLALAVASVLTTSVAFGQEPTPPVLTPNIQPAMPPVPNTALAPRRVPHAPVPAIPAEEVQPAQSSNPSADISPVPAAGTTLSPPVTITYSGSSNAVTIKDSGTNRGLSSTLSSSSNSNSAVYGETNGKGAGVKGINYGTGGSGGIFQITDSASSQPSLSASTSGTGSAIVGNITKTNSNAPAILGQVSAEGGIGVEGTSGGTGIYGYASGFGAGVIGASSSGNGVVGEGDTGTGVYGSSGSSSGVVGTSNSGFGIFGRSNTETAIYAYSEDSMGIFASSGASYGVWGQSKNMTGVIGQDLGSGTGVYGSSASGTGVYGASSGTGYAGYFAGKVGARSFVTLSDRNSKAEMAPVDGSDVLERISELPISSWTFKDDPNHRHMGPMAQDFHAAFGLNGEDDTHINLADSAGVSLVAIQELNKRLKQKDAQIDAMKAQIARNAVQLAEMNAAFSARVAKLEQHTSSTAGTATGSAQLVLR